MSKFLEDETQTLQDQLAELNGKITNFKGKHVGALPELLQVNLQSLDRSDRDLMQLKDQLRTLRDKESYLVIQLTSMPTTGTANADKVLLKELRARLAQLQSKYSDQYPDVIKTKREIAELEGRIDKTASEGPGKRKSEFNPVEQSDNEAYVTLASQLAATRSDIESTQRQLNETERKRGEYQRRIEASPRVDETYKTLVLERNNIQAKFDDLTRKSMEAKVAQGLEKGQMGERFTLIDPARLPGKPVKPNRLAIILDRVHPRYRGRSRDDGTPGGYGSLGERRPHPRSNDGCAGIRDYPCHRDKKGHPDTHEEASLYSCQHFGRHSGCHYPGSPAGG